MSTEADLVCKVAEEVNGWITETREVTLQTIRWTENAWPGVGEDAQAVINHQFPKDFELLVMLMGTRLGTPTGRSASGTVEEFERAFKRIQTGDPVKIFAYFSDKAVRPSTLDLTQFEKVRSFQADVQKRGVLTFPIIDESSFEKDFRKHIMKELERWVSRAVPSMTTSKQLLSARHIKVDSSARSSSVSSPRRSEIIISGFRAAGKQPSPEVTLEDVIRDVISIESQNLGLQMFLDQRFMEMMQMRLITETGINPEWDAKSKQILEAVSRYQNAVSAYSSHLQKVSGALLNRPLTAVEDPKRVSNIIYRLEELISTNEDLGTSISRFPEFNKDDKSYRRLYDDIRQQANTRLSHALITLRSLV